MKTHFAELESAANESNNHEYWSDTLCGTYSENIDNNWHYVDCKKCLKRKEQHNLDVKIAMEHSCNDMGQFMDFIDKQ